MATLAVDVNGKKLIGIIYDESLDDGFKIVFNQEFKSEHYFKDFISESAKVINNTMYKEFTEKNFSHVSMKKVADKGKFASGANTFKIQTLVQYACVANDIPMTFETPQRIASFQKKDKYEFPASLKKYQHTCYQVAKTGDAFK